MASRKAASPISKQDKLKDGSQIPEFRSPGKSMMLGQVPDQAEKSCCRSGLSPLTVIRVTHSSVITRQVHMIWKAQEVV